jgi:hypothetical protein
VLAGAVAVEGAGLEKGVKGFASSCLSNPRPAPLYETSFLRKGRFSYGYSCLLVRTSMT